MTHQEIEFHNIAALEPHPAAAGELQMLRVPFNVGRQMSDRGRWNSQQTPGCELRFVTEATHFRLFLSSLEGDAEVLVYRGENLVTREWLAPGGPVTFHVHAPSPNQSQDSQALAAHARFAPHVWRVVLAGYQPVFHGLDTFGWEVRPPRDDEKPKLTWLAYGSSITAGSGSARTDMCYAQLTARHLGVDLLNMGFGGACHCEGALADFFAAKEDWDFATLELGINMRSSFEPDEFAQRAQYLIDQLLNDGTHRPIILITPFITGLDHASPCPLEISRQRDYEKWMRQRVEDDSSGRLFLVEGTELLSELSMLCADMVHPDPYGHVMISQRLASAMRRMCPSLFEGLPGGIHS